MYVPVCACFRVFSLITLLPYWAEIRIFSQHVTHTQKLTWLTSYREKYMFLKVFALKYMLLHSHPFSTPFPIPVVM